MTTFGNRLILSREETEEWHHDETFRERIITILLTMPISSAVMGTYPTDDPSEDLARVILRIDQITIEKYHEENSDQL